jgi:hypothetical protein
MCALGHKDKKKMVNKTQRRRSTACSPILGTYARSWALGQYVAAAGREPEQVRLVVQRIGALGYHPLGLIVRCSSRLAGS